ncbi:hypothetical protein [Herbaspirillum seropedicae]|uniref:hypothetical protein n=1 Tax=Herbaspirillum seropedicae TaxID=964 RepID=UPI0008638873|nr:hypothetical protein [Herbaspirillum seropedicae]AON52337.1 hypothetical protein Hsc_0020 [Herbaspirillum seropedicae]
MIKLLHHIGCDNNAMEQKAEAHWVRLNPLKRDGNYHYHSLVGRVNRAAQFVQTQEFTDAHTNRNRQDAILRDRFFSALTANRNELLKNIIISAPTELHEIKARFHREYGDMFSAVQAIGTKRKRTFSEFLQDHVFKYDLFRKSDHCLELLSDLGFESAFCPYCNVHLVGIAATEVEQHRKAYVSVDHFFGQALYPYLGLSFFNLIPACSFCNQNDKGAVVFELATHIHPHVESFDDWFEFDVANAADLYGRIERLRLTPKMAGRGQDRTGDDLKIVEKYSEASLSSLNEWLNIYRAEIGVQGRSLQALEMFRKMILASVPINKEKILTKSNGKCHRDLLIRLGIAADVGIQFT